MAFVRLKNGKGLVVPPEKGRTIWRVMNAEIKGTKAQRNFVKMIRGLYLNRDNAPASYLEKHPLPRVHRQPVVEQGRLPYVD